MCRCVPWASCATSAERIPGSRSRSAWCSPSPVALIMSQIDQAEFRTGALAVAFVVVIGLAITLAGRARRRARCCSWARGSRTPTVSETCPTAAISSDSSCSRSRSGRGVRAEAVGRRPEERARPRRPTVTQRTPADHARRLRAAARRRCRIAAGVIRVVAEELTATAGCVGVFLVTRDGNRVEFLVVAGHDPTKFPQTMPDVILEVRTPGGRRVPDRQRRSSSRQRVRVSSRSTRSSTNYHAQSGHQAWAAIPVPDRRRS